ncbi:YitT family protein, partial [Desemzia incerta]
LVYMGNSTTGGTAIIGALIQKRFPQFSMGKLLTGANLVIVVASIFVFGNIDSAIFAGICIYLSGLVMDRMIYGMNTNRLLFIISDKSSAIEQRIMEDLGRGVTVLKGEGGYRHSQKNIIFCVVSKSQFYKVRKITMQVDEGAFIVGCEAGDVLGRGFKHLD